MDLGERFDTWMAEHDDPEAPATPAATVLLLRDADAGLEVLMVQRSGRGSFASFWVFPGGKLEPEDMIDGQGIEAASRRAAARETAEEVDVQVDGSAFVPFSHWMPPTSLPKRYSTWFYACEMPDGPAGDVTIDGGEIVDHLWVTPTAALERHAAGEVELAPPTWITLDELSGLPTVRSALATIASREPTFFLTRHLGGSPPTIAWHGDAGYDSGDCDAPGGRHRLTMDPDGWRYIRSA